MRGYITDLVQYMNSIKHKLGCGNGMLEYLIGLLHKRNAVSSEIALQVEVLYILV